MSTTEILRASLLSPIVLAFGLGVLACLVRSELRLPQALYTSLSIYLLLAYSLTLALPIIFLFNVIVGIRLFWRLATIL